MICRKNDIETPTRCDTEPISPIYRGIRRISSSHASACIYAWAATAAAAANMRIRLNTAAAAAAAAPYVMTTAETAGLQLASV